MGDLARRVRAAVTATSRSAGRLVTPAARPVELVETDEGRLALDPADRIITPHIRASGGWAPEETAVLRRALSPGDAMIDVGANVGYLTLVASRAVGRAGRVLAVEPDPANLALLHANLRAARRGNVRVLAAGAWSHRGRLDLYRSVVTTGDHRILRADPRDRPLATDPGARASVRVPVIALDEVVPRRWPVRVVKVDVQGADHVAIAGLGSTIQRCRPLVMVEFWPAGILEFGDDPVGVAAAYRRLGRLRVLDHRGNERPAPDDDAELVAVAAGGPGWFGFCTLLIGEG